VRLEAVRLEAVRLEAMRLHDGRRTQLRGGRDGRMHPCHRSCSKPIPKRAFAFSTTRKARSAPAPTRTKSAIPPAGRLR